MINQQQMMGLDESHLTPCLAQHKLSHEASQAFMRMRQAADNDGISLDIASSFRGFERQLSIWQQKWQGQRPLNTLAGETLNLQQLSEQQKLEAILLWSALPGASRHHWGTDLDVYDRVSVEQKQHKLELVPEEYNQPQGPCYQLNQWLQQHAASYGFFRPYAEYTGGVAPEPWHLSYQPEAESIIQRYDYLQLHQQLLRTEIGGQSLILGQLPKIFQRYVLNQGIKS